MTWREPSIAMLGVVAGLCIAFCIIVATARPRHNPCEAVERVYARTTRDLNTLLERKETALNGCLQHWAACQQALP